MTTPQPGQKFGALSFLETDPNIAGRWRMSCGCGVVKSFLASNLKSGLSKSCGAALHRISDISWNRFGRLVAIHPEIQAGRPLRWVCRCDCGSVRSYWAANLANGDATSCGCYAREASSSRGRKDLTGQRFGRLTAISRLPGPGDSTWRCICDCGALKDVLAASLSAGRTISCGCASTDKPGLRSQSERGRIAASGCRRRALKVDAGGAFTADQIDALYRKQRGRCACCSASLKDGYHRDHRVALSRGGTNDIANIELLCPPCNLRKSAKDEIEWANDNGRLL